MKLNRILVAISLSLLLCSCTSTSVEKEHVESKETELSMVTSSVEYSTIGAGNESGYYYIDYSNSDGSTGCIRYIDYNTATDIPLTAQITSDNGDDTSESYLESTIGGGTLFLLKDNLFYLRCGASVFYDQYGKDALPAIYMMNLDGSNRKLIAQGKSNEEFLTTIVADEDNIYYLYNQIQTNSDENISAKEFLGRINLNTGHQEQLVSVPYGSRILGTYKNRVILNCIYALPENNYSIQQKLLSFDVDNFAFETLDAWDTHNRIMYCYICEENLLKVDLTNRQFIISTLNNDSENQIIDAKDIFSEGETSIWYPTYYDGYFICQGDVGSQMWAINLKSGIKSTINIAYYNSEKKQEEPFEICSGNNTLLLLRKTIQVTDTGFSNYQYAIINKDDYFENNFICDYISQIR